MQNDAIIFERNDDGSNDLGNSGGFYFPLNRIALGQNKRAYVTDPINPGSSTLDFIFSLSPLAIVADDATKTIRSLRKKENFPNKDTPKVSRRNSLKLGGGLALFYLFLGSYAGANLRYVLGDKDSLTGTLTYGDIDYRNIKIAEGILKICYKVDDIKNLVAFHVFGHSTGIDTYVENEVFRLKKFTYLPFEATSRLYSTENVSEYIPTSNGWHLTRSF